MSGKRLRETAFQMIQCLEGRNVTWEEFGIIRAAWRNGQPEEYLQRIPSGERAEVLRSCWNEWMVATANEGDEEKSVLMGLLVEVGGKRFILS